MTWCYKHLAPTGAKAALTNLEAGGFPHIGRQSRQTLRMVKRETHFQIGICPHCPDNTRQAFVQALNECNAPMTERGKLSVYGEVHTLSLFRCDGCNAILLYKTHYCDFVPADEAEKLDQKWIFDFDDVERGSDFQELSCLQYATPRFQEEWVPIQRLLSSHIPEEVKNAYNNAFKVKREPTSFVIHIRRALELICRDKGKPGKNLKKDLEELANDQNFPPVIAQIAQELREIGNTAAHPKAADVNTINYQQLMSFSFWYSP